VDLTRCRRRVAAARLEIRPLAPSRVADVRTVLASSFGSQCWDLLFRFTDEQKRAAGIAGKMTLEHEARRREILAKLARRKRGSAGLVAYANASPSASSRSDRAPTTPASSDRGRWQLSTTSRCGSSRASLSGRDTAAEA